MSLWAEYLKEYDGFETVEIPDIGFAIYKIQGPECYIRDVYITPEYRGQKVSVKLGELVMSIAKEANCTNLIGTVKPSYKDSNQSLRLLQADGWYLVSASADLIVLHKRIV